MCVCKCVLGWHADVCVHTSSVALCTASLSHNVPLTTKQHTQQPKNSTTRYITVRTASNATRQPHTKTTSMWLKTNQSFGLAKRPAHLLVLLPVAPGASRLRSGLLPLDVIAPPAVHTKGQRPNCQHVIVSRVFYSFTAATHSHDL